MKKNSILIMLGLVVPIIFMAFIPESKEKSAPINPQYIVVAWNDLGMHCANIDFSNICILPPYNNQKAQVILKGSPTALPQVMNGSGGIYVTYEIPGNTQSVTKTNFWNYAQTLFGVTLQPNMGLAGFGMSGTMSADPTNYFKVEGIPITAYPDATPTVPDPYQLTLIKAFSAGNELLATTQSVIPVAHEINCVSSGCHSSELNILQKHESVQGFDINNRPIFCATCHSDNALGMPGKPGVPPFSQVIHEKHGEFIKTGTSTDCYKCHPGPNTQCWRDVMHGTPGGITNCQNCHGSVYNVGKTVENGRNPWLQEPSCGATSCHGPNYAEEPGKLFRNSKGHGGLFCSACHGSPHAIFPSENPRDNVQNIALQGFSGTLSDCSVCHGYLPTGPGPHGITNSIVQNLTVQGNQTGCYSATGTLTVAGSGTTVIVENGGIAKFVAGHKISFLPGTSANAGSYLHGYIATNNQYCVTPASPAVAAATARIEQNHDASVFKVYPNPTTGNFVVEVDPFDTRETIFVDVYGTQGEKLTSQEMTGKGVREFQLTGRPAGVYFVRLVSGKQVKTAKIVKQ
jgi:hypothetical protein